MRSSATFFLIFTSILVDFAMTSALGSFLSSSMVSNFLAYILLFKYHKIKWGRDKSGSPNSNPMSILVEIWCQWNFHCRKLNNLICNKIWSAVLFPKLAGKYNESTVWINWSIDFFFWCERLPKQLLISYGMAFQKSRIDFLFCLSNVAFLFWNGARMMHVDHNIFKNMKIGIKSFMDCTEFTFNKHVQTSRSINKCQSYWMLT